LEVRQGNSVRPSKEPAMPTPLARPQLCARIQVWTDALNAMTLQEALDGRLESLAVEELKGELDTYRRQLRALDTADTRRRASLERLAMGGAAVA
jgi:hypothetical protein